MTWKLKTGRWMGLSMNGNMDISFLHCTWRRRRRRRRPERESIALFCFFFSVSRDKDPPFQSPMHIQLTTKPNPRKTPRPCVWTRSPQYSLLLLLSISIAISSNLISSPHITCVVSWKRHSFASLPCFIAWNFDSFLIFVSIINNVWYRKIYECGCLIAFGEF